MMEYAWNKLKGDSVRLAVRRCFIRNVSCKDRLVQHGLEDQHLFDFPRGENSKLSRRSEKSDKIAKYLKYSVINKGNIVEHYDLLWFLIDEYLSANTNLIPDPDAIRTLRDNMKADMEQNGHIIVDDHELMIFADDMINRYSQKKA